MGNLKGISMAFASAAVIILFSIIIFSENGAINPTSRGDNTEQVHDNYVSYLSSIEVHDQINQDTAYIGNNGSLGKFHSQILPGKYFANGMELQTSEDPMGINMNYRLSEGNSATDFEKDAFIERNLPYTLIFNATVYFTFFDNGEFVTFHINSLGETISYTFNREQIEELYGKDVRVFKEDKKIWQEEVMQKVLNDRDMVESFIAQIQKSE